MTHSSDVNTLCMGAITSSMICWVYWTAAKVFKNKKKSLNPCIRKRIIVQRYCIMAYLDLLILWGKKIDINL